MVHLQYITGLSLLLILVCLKSSNAIRCYQCNSYADKRCSDTDIAKYKTELEMDCPNMSPPGSEPGTKYKLCRKIKQVIDFEVNGLQPESRIIRTCGWDDSHYKNKCYQRSGFGGRQEVCACEEDGCNSSSALYASVALLMGLLIVHL
ncbi:uncharacterized protein LOC663924 [Tribolium castaneum]|uniref:Uncharacterized protein n=1 Tax=Tribolium castaneum TaxID=7070 RepID=D6WV98_TRICA|nr:PREDICTED: uncharacterized protein LOC663924 [Tribolium castaneum]EFA07757.1 hypothetical protein TcasGA2_TC005311 [Tribolium castaneum]|eukprot:XP_008197505.1 PREDICTED: uncharacterized protein LOC663924 [Tribolium castaneum]